MKKILLAIFFFILLTIPVQAQSTICTVTPYSAGLQNTTPQQYIDSSGADSKVSFWDVPLWIKIACAIQAIVGILLLVKVVPFVFGKIIRRYRTSKPKSILKHIANNPGITMSQVSKETGFSRGTVKYYILNMVASGKITVERAGKFSRLFNKNYDLDHSLTEKIVSQYLRNNVDSRILHIIQKSPGMTSAELADQLSVNRSSIHWHIKNFIDDEIVTFDQDGMNKRYSLKPFASELIVKNDIKSNML